MADLRPGILRLYGQGKTQAEISRLLNIDKSTVSRAINRYEETGSNEDRPRSGRPVTSKTEENIEKIAEKICYCNDHEAGHIHSNSDSTRKLANELGISRESVRQMIEGIFQMKSRKTTEGQQLNEEAKKKRMDRSKKLARRFAANRHRNILFTDEKWFDIEQAQNSQNDRLFFSRHLSSFNFLGSGALILFHLN